MTARYDELARIAKFPGFPARSEKTAIPSVFFSDLLPQLAAEPQSIAVALYAFRLLQSKHGAPRYITEDDLATDTGLAYFLVNECNQCSGVTAGREEILNSLRSGLETCVAVGILIPVEIQAANTQQTVFVLNSPADRRGIEMLRADGLIVRAGAPPDPRPRDQRTIFGLYEALIGTLGPGIAEELTEAERLYPPDWLEAAFREAAAQNVRSWRYVSRILERWASEGRDHAKTERDTAGDERYFKGKYGRILKQRLGD